MTTLNTISFTDDLQWTDEFSWRPVEQSVQRTITGGMVVQSAARLAGRPITLQADSESVGWFTRAQIDALAALAETPNLTMTLTYRGVSRSVIWRHQDTALEVRPVVPFADVNAADNYIATLRFLTV